MMISNLINVFAVVGLVILRCGVPIVGIWLLGVVLKHAVGTHKDSGLTESDDCEEA